MALFVRLWRNRASAGGGGGGPGSPNSINLNGFPVVLFNGLPINFG